jgi:hypothetical protein
MRLVAWRRRNILYRAPVHQTQHHSPRTRVGGAAPPGSRRRASCRLYGFRPYPPWVVGAGSGRVPGPKFAAGTAGGAAGGFLGHREGHKSVGFCPLGGAHQSAWSLYIGCAPPYTAQKVSGGCVRAISGNRSCLRRMHSLRWWLGASDSATRHWLAGLSPGPGGFSMRPACQRARRLQKIYHAAGGECRNRTCQVRSWSFEEAGLDLETGGGRLGRLRMLVHLWRESRSMEPPVVGRGWRPVSSNNACGCCCRTPCRPPS